MNFDKESITERNWGGGGGGGGQGGRGALGGRAEGQGAGVETKIVCQCRACGTINISKYVSNFLSTNPTTLV